MTEDQKNKLRSLAKSVGFSPLSATKRNTDILSATKRNTDMFEQMEKRKLVLEEVGISRESIEALRLAAIKLGGCTTTAAWNWFFYLTSTVMSEINTARSRVVE
jgi:hypothetical protein